MTFLKGFAVGAAMLVPGASGGTAAIILGIYDRLIGAVSSLRKNFFKNAVFLSVFSLGGILGILALSKAVLYLFESKELVMRFLFSGIIAGSIPALLKKSGQKVPSGGCVLSAAAGALLCIALSLIPDGAFSNQTGLLSDAVCGVIVAVALVLPGISASHMLLVMGKYEQILQSIESFDILSLAPFGIFLLLGIFLTASLLEKLMSKYSSYTFFAISGFVVASLSEVITIFPSSVSELIYCFSAAAAGFIAAFSLSRKA